MDTIGTVLQRYKVKENQSTRPVNLRYECALRFGKYVGLHVLVVLRLFKLYGQSEVMSIQSWLADCPYDPRRGGKIALAHWKLKDLRAKKSASKPQGVPVVISQQSPQIALQSLASTPTP